MTNVASRKRRQFRSWTISKDPTSYVLATTSYLLIAMASNLLAMASTSSEDPTAKGRTYEII